MPRDKTVLFMTLGIGGKNKENLANGLYNCIATTNTDLIVFFVSEKSQEIMIPLLKEIYFKNKNKELDHYELVEFDNVDNFDKIFNTMKSEVLKYKNDYSITVNYNSGTKTMTMTAALISALYNTDLIFIEARRNDEGYPEPNTESIKHLNLYQYYDELLIKKLKENFNKNNFESGKILFKDITSINIDKKAFEELFYSYYFIDNVNFEEAFAHFDSTLFKECKGLDMVQLGKNSKALNIINTKNVDDEGNESDHQEKDYYILASILNNAQRKYKGMKYDDAIARLYRSLEYIAQIRLEKDYGIDSSDVDINILKSHNVDQRFINKIENKNTKNISLNEDYFLLNFLDDDLGKYYMANLKKIRNMLKFRNKSILAHGTESLSKKQYEDFNKEVLKFANILKPNIKKYIEETEFPKFEI